MALVSPHDERDLIFEEIVGYGDYQPLPLEYVLSVNPPRNQGARPTCAAFVGAGIAEFIHLKGQNTELSPEFIYAQRDTAEGMYARKVFAVLNKLGVATEDSCPYQSAETLRISAKVLREAKKYRVSGYARLNSIDGICRAVFEVGPVYIALPMYNDGATFWKPSNVHETACGHAVTVIGWNSAGLIFKNSWGEDWGDSGYGLLPYGDFDYVLEAWCVVCTKLPKQLGLIKRLKSLIGK